MALLAVLIVEDSEITRRLYNRALPDGVFEKVLLIMAIPVLNIIKLDIWRF
jgi:hypothetical protein